MRQFHISCTIDSEPLRIEISGPPDQNGDRSVTAEIALPTSDGATEQIFGLQEGESLTIV